MKRFLNLPVFAVGAGLLGLVLRRWLVGADADGRGLVASGHPAEALIWLLTACIVIGLVLGTRNLIKGPKYSFNYPASVPGAIGAGLGAVAIFLQAVSALAGGDFLQKLSGMVGILAAVGIGFAGLCRWKGIRISVLFHGTACVYLMLQLISLYRIWCGTPQLMEYSFQLLAVVSLMLSVYERACFDTGMGKRRSLALSHLFAVYFCLSSAGDGGIFFLFTAIWMVTDLCNLMPAVSRRRFNR